jgi:hypothetical protein
MCGSARAREEESRSGKVEEAGGNGEHVPATGETGGEAGREIRVRRRPTTSQQIIHDEPSR